jgi:hypothetical protein
MIRGRRWLAVLLPMAVGGLACHAQGDLLKMRDVGADTSSNESSSNDAFSEDVVSNDVVSNDLSSNDVASNDVSTNDDVSSNDVSSNDVSSDDVSSDDGPSTDGMGPPTPDAGSCPHGNGRAPQLAPLFGNAVLTTVPSDLIPRVVAIGDVTGDGRADVVIGAGCADGPICARLIVFPQQASGALGAPIVYPVSDTMQTITDLDVVDVDGDQRLDVVLPAASGVGLMLQTTSGTLGPLMEFPTGQTPYEVAARDVDSDGRVDLIAGSCRLEPDVDVYVTCGWLQTAPGTFSGPQNLDVPGYTPLIGPLIGDVNGDGRDDLVSYGNSIDLSLQLPGGGFAPPVSLPLEGVLGTQGAGITDANDDCLPDLVFSMFGNGSDARLGVMLQTPSGAFAAPTFVQSYELPTTLVVVDVDGDGRDDAVVLNDAWGAFSVHRRLAAGGFTVAERYAFFFISEIGSHMFTVGDVNSDGLPDVVGVDGQTSTLAVSYHRQQP